MLIKLILRYQLHCWNSSDFFRLKTHFWLSIFQVFFCYQFSIKKILRLHFLGFQTTRVFKLLLVVKVYLYIWHKVTMATYPSYKLFLLEGVGKRFVGGLFKIPCTLANVLEIKLKQKPISLQKRLSDSWSLATKKGGSWVPHTHEMSKKHRIFQTRMKCSKNFKQYMDKYTHTHTWLFKPFLSHPKT